jgi:hypothetical protein
VLPTQHVVVERGPVSNFATAIADANPVFHDGSAAAEAGFERMPTPPTYNFVMHTFGAFAELQPPAEGDANPVTSIIAQLMGGGGMILHGEQEFTYHRAVLVGDALVGTGMIKDIYVKQSGDKTMTFVVSETTWRDPYGDPVCSSTMTLIHRV